MPPLCLIASTSVSQGSSSAPIVLLIIGILSVLGLIIGLKLNAFLALILSALIVSLGVGYVDGEDAGKRMADVVNGFGAAAGSIGIAIAMAAIIGKCMLDSGAADRIVLALPVSDRHGRSDHTYAGSAHSGSFIGLVDPGR